MGLSGSKGIEKLGSAQSSARPGGGNQREELWLQITGSDRSIVMQSATAHSVHLCMVTQEVTGAIPGDFKTCILN